MNISLDWKLLNYYTTRKGITKKHSGVRMLELKLMVDELMPFASDQAKS